MASIYETYLRRYLNDNGKLWSSDQVERWALRAEQEICRVHPAVIIREQLPISAGIPLYDVPPAHVSNIPSLGINQISYKGHLLTALSLQQAHDLLPQSVITDPIAAFSGAFEASAFDNGAFDIFSIKTEYIGDMSNGRPEYWWYAGYNENQIQLYPNPNETISYNPAASRFWDVDIPNYCVIEYRTFSYGPAGDQKPLWRLVRQLIKDYVLAEAFSIEGKGQQIREAVMLRKRFDARLNLYRALAHNVFVANKHTFSNQTTTPIYNKFQLNYGNDIGIRVRR